MAKQEPSKPIYGTKVEGLDRMIPMRDGTRLAVDIYLPDAKGRFPTLLGIAPHNKFLQEGRKSAMPAGTSRPWAPLWCGPAEGGDTTFLTSRGYAHVIGNLRGFGNSDPGDPFTDEARNDLYDLIEWIAQQPWCDGNVGMIGISWFGRKQLIAAMKKPPHLKAIFPLDPCWFSFRDMYPGGMIHAMLFHLGKFSAELAHEVKLTPEEEKCWKEAFNNPDYRMYRPFLMFSNEGKAGRTFL